MRGVHAVGRSGRIGRVIRRLLTIRAVLSLPVALLALLFGIRGAMGRRPALELAGDDATLGELGSLS